MIIEIKGDIRDTDCELIAHGVNCQNVMGSGVAKALSDKWPIVKAIYHEYFEEFDPGQDGENFLGEIDCIHIERSLGRPSPRSNLFLVNCFTQQFYGYDGKKYLDYSALARSLGKVRELCENYDINEIAIPKIGCGLAGGDWNIVKDIIESELASKGITVKVYSLE